MQLSQAYPFPRIEQLLLYSQRAQIYFILCTQMALTQPQSCHFWHLHTARHPTAHAVKRYKHLYDYWEHAYFPKHWSGRYAVPYTGSLRKDTTWSCSQEKPRISICQVPEKEEEEGSPPMFLPHRWMLRSFIQEAANENFPCVPCRVISVSLSTEGDQSFISQ